MIAPARVLEPRSLAELAAAVGETAARGETLAALGGETELELGNAPRPIAAAIRTRGCRRVVEYAPLDQTIEVEAGMTLAELAATTAANGQRLALDPPLGERATIGGLVATNAFGPRRARYGSIRDVIVGISFVRANGTLAHGGGKVVKNVAGFDLPKLLTGSLGTLGVIATATFRLHPLPEAAHSVICRNLDAARVRALAALLTAARLEPAAVIALDGHEGYDVVTLFEGFAAGVAAQARGLIEHAARAGLDAHEARAGQAEQLFGEHDRVRTRGALRIKLSAAPASFETLDARVIGPLRRAVPELRCTWYASVGCGYLSAPSGEGDAAVAAIRSARAVVEDLGGTLVRAAAPAPVRAAIESWGTPPPSFPIMRRLKERFDPHARLNPGRFVGGL